MPPATDKKWILTYTGKQFWPLQPRWQDVCIEDISHALAMKCRFTGHTREFYSVAQHSVLASYIVPECDALAALMHDATEAYLPDVARPVKQQLRDFKAIEDRLHQCIARKFGLAWPMPDSIKDADLILYATERRDLMPHTDAECIWSKEHEPLPESIIPWSPSHAKAAFFRRFYRLRQSPELLCQHLGLVPKSA